jgi:integrase
MKWHDLPVNPAADAEPPAIPAHTPAALTPEQVGVLLAAVHHHRRPWLRAFVVLAAATGARTGELCGLEWHDLNLDAGTVRFRQALSSIDQQLATGRPRPGPRLRPRHRLQAHPHLLRHSLASAMAAAKEPASVIAGQLRHADGGTLASRTYIHQLPQTPPRLARLIEDLYGPAARQA